MISQLLEQKFEEWLSTDTDHTADKFIALCAEEHSTTEYTIERILEKCEWFTTHTPLFSISHIEGILPCAVHFGKYQSGKYVPATLPDGTKIEINGVPESVGISGIYYVKRRSNEAVFLYQDPELTVPVNRENESEFGPFVDYSGGMVEVIYA
jgi:hypothetical protein